MISAACEMIATVLAHSLWQGCAIGVATFLALRASRGSSPQARYGIALAGFGCLAAAPLITAGVVGIEAQAAATDIASSAPVIVATAPAVELTARVGDSARWEQARVWCVVLWGAGVFVMAIRLLIGAASVLRLQSQSRPFPPALRALSVEVARRLGMRRLPRLGISDAVSEAMVVGVWRPMVLLPSAWLMELSPEVLEAVLAHELAHLRRLDPWINGLQRVVEALLFFHPAVWWLSRRVRLERELCCDDLAVAATCRPVAYARTLELVARRHLDRRVPLLASGIGDQEMRLLHRVKRVLESRAERRSAGWLPPMLATGLVLAGVVFYFSVIQAPASVLADDREEGERGAAAAEESEGEGARREREDGEGERERERPDREGERGFDGDFGGGFRGFRSFRFESDEGDAETNELIERLRQQIAEMRERVGDADVRIELELRDVDGDGDLDVNIRRNGEVVGQRDGPPREGDRPRDADRPREGGPRDGDRPREGPRDGDRPREGAPRDGDRPREGGPRDGERPREAGPRDGDRPREGAPRDGDRPREGGPRDGDRPRPDAPRDGDRPREGGLRDGDRPREGFVPPGLRDRPDEGDRPREPGLRGRDVPPGGPRDMERPNIRRPQIRRPDLGERPQVREGERPQLRDRDRPPVEGGPNAVREEIEQLRNQVRELNEAIEVLRRELEQRERGDRGEDDDGGNESRERGAREREEAQIRLRVIEEVRSAAAARDQAEQERAAAERKVREIREEAQLIEQVERQRIEAVEAELRAKEAAEREARDRDEAAPEEGVPEKADASADEGRDEASLFSDERIFSFYVGFMR